MIRSISARGSRANPDLIERERSAKEDNVAWVERIVGELKIGDDEVPLLLIGGSNSAAFRIRAAQSLARFGLTPSLWSHVAVVSRFTKNIAKSSIREISLEPARGFGFPPSTNGVQESTLGDYRDTGAWPNIAVIAVKPAQKIDIKEVIANFERARGSTDVLDCVIAWLSYLWGVENGENPLRAGGRGVPSAIFAETVLAALGFEITPSLASRSSCPEAIWQAARWWHDYYSEQKHVAPRGAWHAKHYLVG